MSAGEESPNRVKTTSSNARVRAIALTTVLAVLALCGWAALTGRGQSSIAQVPVDSAGPVRPSPFVVATKVIPKGSIIKADSVGIQTGVHSSYGVWISSTSEVIGHQAKTRIAANTMITPDQISADPVKSTAKKKTSPHAVTTQKSK